MSLTWARGVFLLGIFQQTLLATKEEGKKTATGQVCCTLSVCVWGGLRLRLMFPVHSTYSCCSICHRVRKKHRVGVCSYTPENITFNALLVVDARVEQLYCHNLVGTVHSPSSAGSSRGVYVSTKHMYSVHLVNTL